MSLADYVYVLASAPYAVEVDVTPSDTTPDLSVVSAASIDVIKADGTTVNWTATISNQTATTLRLTHVFAAAGADLPGPAGYFLVLVPKLTTPSGVQYGVPVPLPVLPLR